MHTRTAKVITLAAGLLLLAGCLEERVVWSPDGSHAAVIGQDGLYLCDAGGRLSDLLVPKARIATWLPDSHRLLLVRVYDANDWATIAATLDEAERAFVAAEGDRLLRELANGTTWDAVTRSIPGDSILFKLYLRDRHAAELKPRMSEAEWNGLQASSGQISELILATLDGDRVTLGPTLQRKSGFIPCVRVNPAADLIAWTKSSVTENDAYGLWVQPLAPAATAVEVARRVAWYPDWLPDGRTVAYIEAGISATSDAADVLTPGVLLRRSVGAANETVIKLQEPEYVAGMLFNQFSHVRCLRDGRLLFNAAEVSLPVAAADVSTEQREQLFAVDPSRHATLTRLIPRSQEAQLPADLSFFAVSPDETQVIVGGKRNEVAVLTLATGQVSLIQSDAKPTYSGVPLWRLPGEFTYVKRTGGSRPAEIVLRRADKETVLSASWPTSVLALIAQENSD